MGNGLVVVAKTVIPKKQGLVGDTIYNTSHAGGPDLDSAPFFSNALAHANVDASILLLQRHFDSE